MREHNQYLIKVQDELHVYHKYLLDPTTELTATQAETFEKIEMVRSWLREGYSDGQVLARAKRIFKIQERRGREVLALAYSIFGELRQNRDKDGIKAVYSEMFRQAAKRAADDGDYKSQALLLKEAAKIDGAYDNQKEVDVASKKKPTKVTIKIKTVNVGSAVEPKKIEDVTHEIIA